MNKKFNSFILVIFLILFSSEADAWIGFYLGPTCTFYPMKGNTAHDGSLSTGFGFKGGFLFISNTSHVASFRMDIAYTWSHTNADLSINTDAYSYASRLEGKLNLSSVTLSPKIQFNLLSERSGFINFGLAPRMSGTNSKGTAYHPDGSISLSGGNEFSDFINRFTLAANMGIGYQEFKAGSVTLFAELTESYDISPITRNTITYPWRALTTSVTIGIRIYRNENYSNEYH